MDQRDSILWVQVVGRATMHQGLSLRRFAEKCLADGITSVHVDLRRCVYMDSTFLGTLLCLQRQTRKRLGELALVCPSSTCLKMFEQLGVADLFQVVVENDLAECAGNDLSTQVLDVGAFQANVLDAHEELACLPGKAGATFAPVARCLAEDMAKAKCKDGR